ncbi:hypothetical protein [Nitrosovibrio tenuis]|uniref:Uncharacterized protein n=1 Tax=Nitrosovibrio tenuis TaxID=1233 RepID=A0A1H7K4W2_9PROT|nr:hypothetical protein [Nitrosovibrio tenuis]SEK81802.1 hypothetical protein SAMN05216387_103106 [Nitrosovibrio tenuis]
MNHPSISGKATPHPLPLTVGLTFSVAALIVAFSASNTVHAQGTSIQRSATSGQPAGMQARSAVTSTGRDRIREGQSHKSGVKKNLQRSNIKQEIEQGEKARAAPFIDRDQEIPRKVRRALA